MAQKMNTSMNYISLYIPDMEKAVIRLFNAGCHVTQQSASARLQRAQTACDIHAVI
jgi:hypothetical protein